MQNKFGVHIHNVCETTQFFGTQKQSNIGQFTYDLKKIKTYNLGKWTFMYFFGEISALHINFLKTKNLNRRGAVSFGKKHSDLSDLTPDVRSYPVLRYQYHFVGRYYGRRLTVSRYKNSPIMLLYSWNTWKMPVLRLRTRDPGPFWALDPDSGIRNRFFPDLGSWIPNPYFWELCDKFLGKSFIILWNWPKFFSSAFQK